MSKKGYYRWTGGDGGYWLNGHTYYYDGYLMSTDCGDTVQSHAKTVNHGGSWEYVGEAPEPPKKPIVYICGDCGADDPCHLVLMKDPVLPPTSCPFNHSSGWYRRTDG